MRHLELEGKFKDERGNIVDVLVTDSSSTTYITFAKGAVRGNHYHNETAQYDLILSGKLICKCGNKTVEVGPGEMITHLPKTPHAYKALEDSEMVSICYGKRTGKNYSLDTFKLDDPLI